MIELRGGGGSRVGTCSGCEDSTEILSVCVLRSIFSGLFESELIHNRRSFIAVSDSNR